MTKRDIFKSATSMTNLGEMGILLFEGFARLDRYRSQTWKWR